ncbi:MAG: zinc-binding alcohol dehydrogenase family protein [Acidimicrobiia bacterium]
MRALLATAIGGPEVLEWGDVPEPSPGPGEVKIKVLAAAVNWSDVLEREGRYPGGPTPPFVIGHDVLGEVVELGEGTDRFAVGDRIYGSLVNAGGTAEYAVAPAYWLHKAPTSLPVIEAAAAPSPFFTAEAAVTTMSKLEKGQTVLVHAAAGGFGSATVQLCRAYGARLIIGTAGGPAKMDHVRSFGADIAVDYLTEDFVEVVREATDGRGVDLVVDSVGGDVLARSFDVIVPTGKMICVGATEGKSTSRFRLHTLFEKDIWVGGFTLGNWVRNHPELMEPIASAIHPLLAEGTVRTIIGGVFTPDQAQEAHAFLQNRQSIGRTVIDLASL